MTVGDENSTAVAATDVTDDTVTQSQTTVSEITPPNFATPTRVRRDNEARVNIGQHPTPEMARLTVNEE